MKRNSGFTLIVLVITIATMVILSGSVILSLNIGGDTDISNSNENSNSTNSEQNNTSNSSSNTNTINNALISRYLSDLTAVKNAITIYYSSNMLNGNDIVTLFDAVKDSEVINIVNSINDIQNMSNDIKNKIATRGNKYYYIKRQVFDSSGITYNKEFVINENGEVYINKKF